MPQTIYASHVSVTFVRCWGVYAGMDVRGSICTEKAGFGWD